MCSRTILIILAAIFCFFDGLINFETDKAFACFEFAGFFMFAFFVPYVNKITISQKVNRFMVLKDYKTADMILSKYQKLNKELKIFRLNLLLIAGNNELYENSYNVFSTKIKGKYYLIYLYSYKIFYDFLTNKTIDFSNFDSIKQTEKMKNIYKDCILVNIIKFILSENYEEANNLLKTKYAVINSNINDFIKYLYVYLQYICSQKLNSDSRIYSNMLLETASNSFLIQCNRKLGLYNEMY